MPVVQKHILAGVLVGPFGMSFLFLNRGVQTFFFFLSEFDQHWTPCAFSSLVAAGVMLACALSTRCGLLLVLEAGRTSTAFHQDVYGQWKETMKQISQLFTEVWEG